jgi:hypothetical protein
MTTGDQFIDQMGPNEPRTAGDEDVSRGLSHASVVMLPATKMFVPFAVDSHR